MNPQVPESSPTSIMNHEELTKDLVKIKRKIIVEWNKGLLRNYDITDELLSRGKTLMTQLTAYLPIQLNETLGQQQLEEFHLVREMLELGARISVAKMAHNSTDDSEEFDRYMAQLKHYYFDLQMCFKSPSDFMYEILGINLLKFLSQNRIAEFHVELELFVHPDYNNVLNNVYIKKAVEMEQYLTEGRYNKILELHVAKEDELKAAGLVSSGFRYFIERVIENSRTAIAEVVEAAYEKLSVKFASNALHLQEDFNLLQRIAHERNWNVEFGFVYFSKQQAEEERLPARDLLKDGLYYAKELDTII